MAYPDEAGGPDITAAPALAQRITVLPVRGLLVFKRSGCSITIPGAWFGGDTHSLTYVRQGLLFGILLILPFFYRSRAKSVGRTCGSPDESGLPRSNTDHDNDPYSELSRFGAGGVHLSVYASCRVIPSTSKRWRSSFQNTNGIIIINHKAHLVHPWYHARLLCSLI